MPVLLEEDTLPEILPQRGSLPEMPDAEANERDPAFLDTLGAAFRQENTVGSIVSAIGNRVDMDYEPNPNVNFEDFIPEKHKLRASHYAFVNTQEQADAVSKVLDREDADRKTIQDAGAMGVASMLAAGIFDPVNLIPVGGTAYRTYRIGGSILRGAAVTARAGLLSSTAAEAVLQHTQMTRTAGEGAVNIAASTFLSGVLGGAVGMVKATRSGARANQAFDDIATEMTDGRIFDDMAKGVERDLTVPPPDQPDPILPGQIEMSAEDLMADTAGSVSAAAARGTTRAEETLKSALGVEKAVKFQDPILRTATSPNVDTRRIAQRLVEQPLTYKKNALGIETPVAVESRVAAHEVGLYRAFKTMDDAFVKYRKGRSKKIGDVQRIGISDLAGAAKREGRMSYSEFKVEIAHALRNADQHPVAEVAEAAKAYRANVFDPLKDDAIKLGILPEDVDVSTAPSYLMRVYNTEKIVAERPEFHRRVLRYLKREAQAAGDRAAKGEITLRDLEAKLKADRAALRKAKKAGDADIRKRIAEAEGQRKELKKLIGRDQVKASMEDSELSDTADQIIDRIISTPDGRLPYDINPNASKGGSTALGGPLKGRSFLIPDREIESFLESDVEFLARAYTRSMSADVELVREFGDVNLTDEIDNIRRAYAQASSKASQSERKALARRRDADIRDIAAMRDRIRHTYGQPSNPDGLIVRTGRVVRTLNYLRLLGGMTVSAFPDAARSVMVHGVRRVVGDGIVPMIKNFKATRLAAEEVRLAGTALDMALDTRAMAIADVMDDFGRYSKFERGLQKMQGQFGVVSLMAPWNAFFKQFSGMVTMSRMLQATRSIAKGAVDGKELEKLASQGINPDDARQIAALFNKYGKVEDGVYFPNTERWYDEPGGGVMVEKFRAGLKKEVDRIIITPGHDKPLWMSTELGKIIGQFKSFSMASVQRAMLSGLQQRDLAALNGSLLMVMAGMGVYAFKQKDADRKLSDNPAVWVSEGLDRSGLFGWFFEANNMIEKVSRGRVGVNALVGGPQMSRYASRNIIGAMIGPTSGFIKDATSTVGSFAQDDWKEADTRALRRLLPYQNLMGFRRLLDAAEEGINDSLGVR